VTTSFYTATASTGPAESITIEKIRAAAKLIDQHERENARRTIADMAGGLFNPFGSLRVLESPMAVQQVPVRRHKKRRNQTEAYHRRIQKKWTKRFGMREQPCALQVNGGQFGLGSILILPPGYVQKMRHAGVLR
jgi:hypothetical protein